MHSENQRRNLDSSYLALKLKEYDLRVLAVHVDGEWNSELAVNNIEAILEHCFDLYVQQIRINEKCSTSFS